ncbi:MAG: pyridoxamine 5'-phosphate oxidase [Alphaproteobacteria bacterium]|nr:pyridoxamine 5'-phosphate oxidase [Alphaproteobacteria bacterium]
MKEAISEMHFEPDFGKDPIALFLQWYGLASKAEPNDPDAACLATANEAGKPSARMVLIKGYDGHGFKFHTNEKSSKGQDLAANASAALCFYWKSLQRQIRVEGPVERIDDATVDAYFASRPREKQIGAWASIQSAPMASRAEFANKLKATEKEYANKDVPRPPFWVGYRIVPLTMEFWLEKPHRLHERLCFRRQSPEAPWTLQWLYP